MAIARVASIHFAPVAALRIYRGNPYQMPEVRVGEKPYILEIKEEVQKDEGPVSLGTDGRRQKLRYLVMADEIARCLVREWTESGRGMTPDCHPGIWVVRDRIAVMLKDPHTGAETAVLDEFSKQVFREPTEMEQYVMWEEDLANAIRVDRNYAEWCWNDGNDIAGRTKTGNGSQTVPLNYKRAARRYSLDAEWLKEAASTDSIPCPSCGRLCAKSAYVCAFCQQPTDLVRWANWQAQKDAALRDAKSNVKQQAA